jgi:hypothetical protein
MTSEYFYGLNTGIFKTRSVVLNISTLQYQYTKPHYQEGMRETCGVLSAKGEKRYCFLEGFVLVKLQYNLQRAKFR